MSPTNLPAALQSVALHPLFVLELSVDAPQAIGGSGADQRRVGPIASGRFEGRGLRGHILPGGSDWQTVTGDGVTHLDARIVLETDAGERIGMTYSGIRHGPPEVMARLAQGEAIDPAEYYFRITATFSTGSPGLEWLNQVIALGTGHRLPSGPIYNLFEVG